MSFKKFFDLSRGSGYRQLVDTDTDVASSSGLAVVSGTVTKKLPQCASERSSLDPFEDVNYIVDSGDDILIDSVHEQQQKGPSMELSRQEYPALLVSRCQHLPNTW